MLVVWPYLRLQDLPLPANPRRAGHLAESLDIPIVDGLDVLGERDASSLSTRSITTPTSRARLMAEAVAETMQKQSSNAE